MKITGTKVRLVEVRDSRALGPATSQSTRPWQVTAISIQTDQGVEGVGVGFSLGLLGTIIPIATELLLLRVIGEDPTRIEYILGKLRSSIGVELDTGVFQIALAAIDMALWDIRGKMAGLPLWKLLGGTKIAVDAYASGTLSRDLSVRELANSAEITAKAGFSVMKIHLGMAARFGVQDIERIRSVRGAVGDTVTLGADINERWRASDAVDVCKRLEPFNLAWIEDPVHHDDFEGLKRVCGATRAPVMVGERLFHLPQFRRLLEMSAVGMVMVDVMLVGGISTWLKIAALAESYNIPVVSHLLPEVSAHLIGGISNGLMAEHKSWLWDLFEELPHLEAGRYFLTDRPGLGLKFNRAVVDG